MNTSTQTARAEVIYDMPRAAYDMQPRYHASQIKRWMQCGPRGYKRNEDAEDTKEAFEFGKAFALLCEGRERFDEFVVTHSNATNNCKAYREARAAHPDQYAIIPSASVQMIEAMYEAKSQHPAAACYCQPHVKRELTINWTEHYDDGLSIPMTCRIDQLLDDCIADDKTIAPRGGVLTDRKCKYETRDRLYDVQLAIYATACTAAGLPLRFCHLVYLEKATVLPEVIVHEVSAGTRINLYPRWRAALRELYEAEQSGEYPFRYPQIVEDDSEESLTGFDE